MDKIHPDDLNSVHNVHNGITISEISQKSTTVVFSNPISKKTDLH